MLSGVYIDLRVIEATRRLVATGELWSILRDNRRLVEGATHAEVLQRIERGLGWQDHAMKVEAKAVAEAQHGALLSLDRSAPFPFKEEFPDADEVVQTRLGSQGPLLQLPGALLVRSVSRSHRSPRPRNGATD
ncbi:hypothetical protein [Acuticoccus sp.]|uniref:hypothetical protein n=1 Tax=Acuticoccus sp. TaxID=1904378 RepID=UPI003B51C1BE